VDPLRAFGSLTYLRRSSSRTAVRGQDAKSLLGCGQAETIVQTHKSDSWHFGRGHQGRTELKGIGSSNGVYCQKPASSPSHLFRRGDGVATGDELAEALKGGVESSGREWRLSMASLQGRLTLHEGRPPNGRGIPPQELRHLAGARFGDQNRNDR
jgi:hypothetical protein